MAVTIGLVTAGDLFAAVWGGVAMTHADGPLRGFLTNARPGSEADRDIPPADPENPGSERRA
ncbi:hypothetical protein [Parafrankia sp. CH37]|uniref:hypothetical protein n=1 Tax=Parafrankia sp. CH37 TaxID=683308 RepID=UPI001D011B87|nr:hypothetical protein [Parafrankia sp. CH37]